MDADFEAAVARAEGNITHTTCGPTTKFVVLMRALRAVAAGADPEVMGNAVYNVFTDRGVDMTDGY